MVSLDELPKWFKLMVTHDGPREVDYHVLTTNGEPLAFVSMQLDITTDNRLTIQQICVEEEFRRQGIARKIIQALKEASVETGRVAHVQSVSNMHLRALLVSEGFEVVPYSRGFCFIWS